MSGTRPFHLSVKALVRDDKLRYLVLKRSAESKNHPGLWDFPGGKIDRDETLDEALLREVSEETNLSIALETVMGAGESELPDRKVVYLFILARIESGEICLSEEHSEFAWLSAAQLPNAELCPQFKVFAQSLALYEQ